MSGMRIIITQGEHAVCADREVMIGTLLGSCVAVCLWDSLAQVGGMNHMLLATAPGAGPHANFSGVHAMECLINDLLKKGCARPRLQAKVFGGARMVEGLSDIGAANCEFAMSFLQNESISVVAQSLGGTEARQLLFRPTTGQVRQKTIQDRACLVDDLRPRPKLQAHGSELF